MSLFKNAKAGLWLSMAAAVLALVGAVVYVAVYMVTAAEEVDRVFSWLTFGLMIGGAVITAGGEFLRLPFTPILSGACFSVALANHLVETAYPLADVLTGVPFFGGDPVLAIVFSVVFGVVALLNVVSAFMAHHS